MTKIYNLGSNMSGFVQEISKQMLFDQKVIKFNELFDNFKIPNEHRQDLINEIFKNEDNIKILDKQKPFWELFVALWLIFGMLIKTKQKLSKLSNDPRILDEII
jgi:F0F1-type ATP synthase delta subunit